MKRRKPIKRRNKSIPRHSRPRPVNKARKAKNTLRAYGPEERRRWVSELPCLACGMGPCDNAHIGGVAEGAGTGYKSDAQWVVPLCSGPSGCHKALHKIGPESFERQTGLDLRAEAARVEERWQAIQPEKGQH